MLNLRVIIKIIILTQVQIIVKSVSFTNKWNDWIIIPAKPETEIFTGKDISKNFSVFNVNMDKNVNDLVNQEEMETFIMRTIDFKDNSKQQQSLTTKSEIKDNFEAKKPPNYDLVIPLGRAIEKVMAVCSTVMDFFEENFSNIEDNPELAAADSSRKFKKKLRKKYKKFLLPLLLAYKLKFLALIPLLMGGLVLLVGTTGMAGFFFALFTAIMSLRTESKVEVKKW